METKIFREGDTHERPSGRLQRQAPAALRLDPTAANPWNNPCAPIPLLSPLILDPLPLPEVERGGDKEQRPPPLQQSVGGGWRHPALPMVVMEPVALLPFFQAQCALVHNVQ